MSQTKGLKRNTIDKYYTKNEVVEICMNEVKKELDIDNSKDCIIEPSAGNGSFIPYISPLCSNTLFYDIEPEHDNIIKQNYLELAFKNEFGKVHIIGNPPFGRQSSMAIKFIKKSCEIGDSISFILPKSFKKDSMRKYFSLNFHLRKEIDLPSNSFLVDDKEHDVPCVFQIWLKSKEERTIKPKQIPIGFEFVDRKDSPHISFRRVGVNAGKIDEDDIELKSLQSHYFIKFDKDILRHENLQCIIESLKKINYEVSGNTVGPKSISKQELIYVFNNVLSSFSLR